MERSEDKSEPLFGYYLMLHVLRRKGTLDSGTEVEDLVKRNIAYRDIDSYREFY